MKFYQSNEGVWLVSDSRTSLKVEPPNAMHVMYTDRHKALELPPLAYAHAGDAGLDLYAVETVTVEPGGIAVVPTGVHVALPAGTYGRIADRSSMAVQGWRVGAGVIDATYRGEVAVVIQNMSLHKVQGIGAGKRIAQLIVTPYIQVAPVTVAELPDSDRGTGGFGSTG